jgi:hypothetical protein
MLDIGREILLQPAFNFSISFHTRDVVPIFSLMAYRLRIVRKFNRRLENQLFSVAGLLSVIIFWDRGAAVG